MYSKEEFDKQKTRILKYIIYQKRSEYEVRNKFKKDIDKDVLEDIIKYLKEAKYINDKDFIEKMVSNIMYLKNLSIKEIKYKLINKGVSKENLEEYFEENYEEINEYEKRSIINIFEKKKNSMDNMEITNYLLKKGYKSDNIRNLDIKEL